MNQAINEYNGRLTSAAAQAGRKNWQTDPNQIAKVSASTHRDRAIFDALDTIRKGGKPDFIDRR